MIELYRWEPNSGSLALLTALNELGLEFASHYVDMLKFEQHAPAFRKLSPRGSLPVLVADGEAMTDTGLALQYLAERCPDASLAPPEPGAWYELQAWTPVLDGAKGLSASVGLLGWNQVMPASLDGDELREIREAMANLPRETQSGWAQVIGEAEAGENPLETARERAEHVVAKMEDTLGESGWLVGGRYSIADILAFAHAHCLPALLPASINALRTPGFIDWLERVGTRPAVKAATASASRSFEPAAFPPTDT